MNNQAFLNLRPQMLNDQCRECFDILAPHFPTVHPSSAVFVNMEHGYQEGGTAICNYNMLPAEAISVAATIKEMDCGCIFVAPVPVSGLFTEQYLGTGHGSTQYASRVLSQVKAAFQGEWIKFPPYFSVHMIGAPWKAECRNTLKQLLIQNLLENKPGAASYNDWATMNLLSRYTLTRK